jgi:hypothetical protein
MQYEFKIPRHLIDIYFIWLNNYIFLPPGALAPPLHPRTKHINALCGQSIDILMLNPGGTWCDHWALMG